MRTFYRLTDRDETNEWSIPRTGYDETLKIGLRSIVTPGIGQDGGYDLHGIRRSPKDPGSARIVFDMFSTNNEITVQQAVTLAMLQAFDGRNRDTALRKAWRRELITSEDERFTWARLTGRPIIALQRGHAYANVAVDLILPDPTFYEAITSQWLTDNSFNPVEVVAANIGEPIEPYVVFEHVGGAAITTTPKTFTLNNNGDTESRWVIFRLESKSATGFTNPKIENLTTGEEWSSTRDGVSASDVLSVNAAPGLGRARYSINNGAVFVDDTNLLSLGVTQAVLMELAPGVNDMRYTDGATPNLDLKVFWYHAYRD